MPNVNLPTQRPAEVGGGLAGAMAALIVAIFGVKDPAVLAPLMVIVGALPAVITWLVATFRPQPPTPPAP